MTQVLNFFGSFLGQLMDFALPWGVTFGVILITAFSLPLLYKLFKRFF